MLGFAEAREALAAALAACALSFTSAVDTCTDDSSVYNRQKIAPVVLVDMDDTVADFTGHALALLAKRHPDILLPDAKNTTFPLANSLKSDDDKSKLKALFVEAGFFRDMAPIPGAVAALHEMVELGFNVRLCSAPLSNSPACLAEKAAWVQQHLGPRWIDRLILTRDKTLVHGDMLIDDAPIAKGDSRIPSWQHVYFTRPHNLPGQPSVEASRLRLDAWDRWAAVLPPILKR